MSRWDARVRSAQQSAERVARRRQQTARRAAGITRCDRPQPKPKGTPLQREHEVRLHAVRLATACEAWIKSGFVPDDVRMAALALSAALARK